MLCLVLPYLDPAARYLLLRDPDRAEGEGERKEEKGFKMRACSYPFRRQSKAANPQPADDNATRTMMVMIPPTRRAIGAAVAVLPQFPRAGETLFPSSNRKVNSTWYRHYSADGVGVMKEPVMMMD